MSLRFNIQEEAGYPHFDNILNMSFNSGSNLLPSTAPTPRHIHPAQEVMAGGGDAGVQWNLTQRQESGSHPYDDQELQNRTLFITIAIGASLLLLNILILLIVCIQKKHFSLCFQTELSTLNSQEPIMRMECEHSRPTSISTIDKKSRLKPGTHVSFGTETTYTLDYVNSPISDDINPYPLLHNPPHIPTY